MQKTNSKLWVRFVPLLMVLGLVMAACGGGTENNDFSVALTPSATSVDVGTEVIITSSAPNATGALTYDWEVDAPSGSQVTTITSTTSSASFTPDVAGEYEVSLTVTDAEGNSGDASTTVTAGSTDGDNGSGGPGSGGPGTGGPGTGGPGTGGPGEPPVTPGAEPTLGLFGVAATNADDDSAYLNDGAGPDNTPPAGISSEDDDRVLDVDPATTIYARITASAGDGVTALAIQIRNLAPESGMANRVVTLTQGTAVDGFTLGAPTGDDCDLSGDEDTVTCTYPIQIADTVDESDLNANEFAYVLRPVINGVEISTSGSRGYVNIPAAASAGN